MKNIVLVTYLICTQIMCSQQIEKPKLIVGIVIDQMRAEYLYRFQNNYTENGFKRLMKEGFNVRNIHYNYVPTATGPGHTSIYTGTTPANHGIIGNNWYSRNLKRQVYCAEDSSVTLVDNLGSHSQEVDVNFLRSPKNVMTSTITDELKLFSNKRSKVIGVSLKDRAAILPAGHLADAAYWYNGNNGNFVTSSYYTNELPKWLKEFNNQKKADSLLNQVWKPFLPIKNYVNSSKDDAVFEKIYKGKRRSTFPYKYSELRRENDNFSLLSESPFGNTIITELALATLKGELLGRNKETDFLTISYSSTDYIGHYFGIRSKELEDTYIRMDREIGRLLDALDKEVGKGKYVLFLTSDHGGSDHPLFLKSNKLPGKFYNLKEIKNNLNSYLSNKFGEQDYIAHFYSNEIYFNKSSAPKEKVVKEAVLFLNNVEGIKDVIIPNSLESSFVKNSYHSKNSGDILLHFNSGWMSKRAYGCSHGTAYNSDTHVPLLWYGWHIPKGQSVKYHRITQIAPTLSFLLNIPLPNSSDKVPISEIFD